MASKYLERFSRLTDIAGFELRGNRLLVEVIPQEELKKGSIVIASSLSDHKSATQENRATLVRVLLVGTGYVDDEGADVPMDLKPGNVVMVPQMALKLYTQFPGLQDFTSNELALLLDHEIHMKWDDDAAYDRYKVALNG